MAAQNSLKQMISAISKDRRVAAVTLARRDLVTSAVVSKLVREVSTEVPIRMSDERRNQNVIDYQSIEAISENTRRNIEDNESTTELFPDVELSIQILVSSIISPKDMVTNELKYSVKKTTLPPDVSFLLLEKIKEHVEGYYELPEKLQTILRESLVERGSYITAFIPESSLDFAINQRSISQESLDRSLRPYKGILGEPRLSNGRLSLESRFSQDAAASPEQNLTIVEIKDKEKEVRVFDKNTTVTDNPNFLILPKIVDAMRRDRVSSTYRLSSSLSLESFTKVSKELTQRELENVVYKNSQNQLKDFVVIKPEALAPRKSIGRSLVLKLPSESVIPVTVAGDNTRHVGYFVLYGEDGHPVAGSHSRRDRQALSSQINSEDNSISSYLINKSKSNLKGSKCNSLTIERAADIYGDVVNDDLLRRLKSGIYGANVEIARVNDVYQIMLSRTFKNQRTRLVFIPEELVSYMTFKYHKNGVGKSLLDDLKTLNSLRAILMFSRTMGAVKNSIGVTEVKLKLDEDDPDPEKTIEVAQHEVLKTRQGLFPAGLNTSSDILDWLQRSGFQFTFEGHPSLPDLNMEFNQKQNSHTMPDTDLEDTLRKQSIMAFGLSPETVDNAREANFATTVVEESILFSKRISNYQKTFSILLKDFVEKALWTDQEFYKDLVEILVQKTDAIKQYSTSKERGYDDHDIMKWYHEIIQDYMVGFEVKLPSPDITTITNQFKSFQAYSEFLDVGLNSIVSSEFITDDVSGDIAKYADVVRAVAKAYYLRKWLSDNNALPELGDMSQLNEEGKPRIDLFGIQSEHIQGIGRASLELIKRLKAFKDAANTDLVNLDAGEPSGTSSSSDSDATSSDGDFGDMGPGDDAFGTDADSGDEDVDKTTDDDSSSSPDLGLDNLKNDPFST